MRRAVADLALAALLLSALAGTLHLGAVEAATEVNGVISSSTTWTKANSPYNLTGSILIDNGVVLTIMAGVTVNLNGNILMVNGTLSAKGTSSNYIEFNGGEIIFTPFSNGWNRRTGSGCIISSAVLASPISILGSSPMISNCSISCTSNPIDISGGSPIVSGNNISAVEHSDSYGNLQRTDVGILLSNNSTAIITENVISGFFDKACISIMGGSPIIQRNVIALSVGIDLSVIAFDYADPTVQNNTFAYCSEAILTGSSTTALTLTVSYNNFENSTKYNLYWVYPANLNAAYNWWGTTDAKGINQTIYDFKNDFSSGSVNFVPFLTEPNSQAPPTPAAMNPPKISVLSPLSQTYNESSVPLLFILDKPANWTGYSLDGFQNITVTGNATLTGLSDGNHSFVIYGNNSYGKIGTSETVHFVVNSPTPWILTAATVVVVVAIVGIGLLVYFKKRNH